MKIPATIICLVLIGYLFWVDRQKSDGVSNAIWIPFIWILFAASRPLSFWLNYWFGIGTASDFEIEEGNSIERAYLSILIASGLIVLLKRKLNWQEILAKNIWVFIFFTFAAISISWSEYPFVSFKRWIRSLGTLIMVLIILSEERPYEAIGVILRRLAFILLPLSVLFIKYYPGLGKSFHTTGAPIYSGVTSHKNSLGQLCMISGTYFAWNLLLNRWQKREPEQLLHYTVFIVMIPLIVWLMYMANSATSLLCLLVGISLFAVGRQSNFAENPRSVFTFGVACILIFLFSEAIFDVKDAVIAALGRRPDLTTRVPMWEELLSMAKNPIIGFGFENFWLGERRAIMMEHWGIDRQAHNGYLDLYLNLGIAGLSLSILYILFGLKKVYNYIIIDYPSAMFRLCFVLIFVLYNWTENVFHQTCVMWLLLLFSIMDPPHKIDVENTGAKYTDPVQQ